MVNTYDSLFWGYCFIWLLMALYILRLALKVSSLEKKIKNIENNE